MRVLVTGGAGFIGSHIADDLVSRGHDVCVLDNLSSGRRENVPAQARFENVDLRDGDAVVRVVRDVQPDAVTHQAAQVSVSRSVRGPLEDATINIVGGLNLLEACRAADCGRRFVFASTGGALYGDVPEGQAATTEWPTQPHSPYAASKDAFEWYLRFYARRDGLEARVLRYANVYGPRQDPHGEAGVVAIFCQRLLRDEPVHVNARAEIGDGGCVRDYVFVADVVEANRDAIESPKGPDVANIGTGRPTTTATLLAHLQEATGSRSAVHQAERRAGDLACSVLQPSRPARVDLADGLARTVAWFRAQQT